MSSIPGKAACVPRLARIRDFCIAVGVSDTTARKMIADKRLRVVRIGSQYRVPIEEVDRIVRGA
jgi:excisionase family DNA binding protein